MSGIHFRAFGSTPDLRLSKAILLYESAHNADQRYHATVHPIHHGATGSPVVMPGTLLTREALEDATVRLANSAELRTWSETLLRQALHLLPAQMQTPDDSYFD